MDSIERIEEHRERGAGLEYEGLDHQNPDYPFRDSTWDEGYEDGPDPDRFEDVE